MSGETQLAVRQSLLTELFTGNATLLTERLGACGELVVPDGDFIAAVSQELFDSFPGATANPYNNSICGRSVDIFANINGLSITVTIVDSCPTCTNEGNLELSSAAFEALGSFDVGRIDGIIWGFD
ncbi:hypothetical protein SCHPADRAFT_941619 [Schizopora paradoxa]|uniref:RlpA-like protein double-psi beta-barrel domain-containing protein n=1 Tax=Schizopora paradoxa TaxID=27342 RepID=A0A0H2RK57_9AGAM|nr:hypothetical protein SCHPADRAFT_941619 [Schizopora paradoxa]